MRGAAGTFGLLLALGVPALATESTRRGPSNGESKNVVLAGAGLVGLGTKTSIDGRPVSAGEGGVLQLELEAGYLRSLGASSWRVGAALRGGTFNDHLALAVGERRYRGELRLLTELSFPFAPSRNERPFITMSAGLGPTVARIVPPRRSLVVERYGTGWGQHAALRLGIQARLFGRHVGYYSMEGAVHRVSADRTAFVRGSTPRSPSERYRFQDFTLGAAAGLRLSL
jgi:hypothetical protein